MENERPQFDGETWKQLPEFLENLPEPVRIHVWGDIQASPAEEEASRLVQSLADRFATVEYRQLPRRINYHAYPVIGVMGHDEPEAIDYGVRLIGLPAGYQITSLIAAIQCVSFRGMTSEARTRIKLHQLQSDVTLELITTADNEAGTVMAQMLFNMAVVSPYVRSYLIMGDLFAETAIRYSVRNVPHLVINERVHLEGLASEETLLRHIAAAVKA